MISSVFLSEFNRSFFEEINVFLLNSVKSLVRVFAKDKILLKRKVVNQWNNRFFYCNIIIYIDFKRFFVNLFEKI